MLCRVCGFRVRVWESYRTSRSFGYGYGSVTELTEVPGGHKNMLYPYPGYCGTGRTGLTEVPATGMNHAELTEVPGTGMKGLTELLEVPGIVARAYRT